MLPTSASNLVVKPAIESISGDILRTTEIIKNSVVHGRRPVADAESSVHKSYGQSCRLGIPSLHGVSPNIQMRSSQKRVHG